MLLIAEKTGQKDKVIQYASKLILSAEEHLQKHYYKLLKSFCSEQEWLIEMEKIEEFLYKNNLETKLAQLFILDNNHDKLKTLLLKSKQIQLLETYIKNLAEHEQKEVAYHWLHLLENKMEEYKTRAKYTYWVKMANKLLKKYPYLSEEMINVAHRFKNIYKQRTALMEELEKLKI